MAVDVSRQIAKAENAYKGRKYDLAIEIYLQALEIDPDNRAGRRGVRRAALKKHEHSYPSGMSIKLGTAAAQMGMKVGSAAKRMSAHEAYLKVDPKNVKAGHSLAKVAEGAGHTNAAIGVYEAMIEYAPKETDAYVALGRLLAQLEPEQALEYLEKALTLNHKHQAAIKLRKDIAAEVSILRTGFETAKTSREMLRDKDQQRDLEQRDRVARTADQAGEMVARLQEQIAGDPKNRGLLVRLAKAQASQGLYDDAYATYGKMLENDPGDFNARVQMGDLRIAQVNRALAAAEKKGDSERVKKLEARRTEIQIKEFGERVAEHPTDLGLRFQLGKSFFAAGMLDQAVGEFQKAIQDPRRRFEALGLLGECFLDKGLYDLAARQLERALEESPGLTSEQGKAVVYNLGLLREKQGDVAAAKEQYLKVYEVDVGFRDVAEKVMQ